MPTARATQLVRKRFFYTRCKTTTHLFLCAFAPLREFILKSGQISRKGAKGNREKVLKRVLILTSQGAGVEPHAKNKRYGARKIRAARSVA
jgi:hypothetical protein